jgi:hypothetical protein
MLRRLVVASLWVGLSAWGCGGAAAEEGEDSGADGSGSGSGGLGDCSVYDGKDEYLACVCEKAKPCQGISPAECPSLIRSTLKFGQHDAGLECVQAIGDFYECQFDLTCAEFDELGEYWSWCWEGDPEGAAQPYCRRETLEVVEVCNSFEFPCNP